MTYPELKPSNANYSPSEFVSRVKALFERDNELLGLIVQRSALSRSDTGQIDNVVTKIDVLEAGAPAPRVEASDYGILIFTSEILDPETFFSRIENIANKTLEAGAHTVTSPGLGTSDRFEPSGNVYNSWPCRVFSVHFNSVHIPFEPLIHPQLKTFSSAFEAIRELLEFPDFGDNDGRTGQVLVCLPNFNARFGRLMLRRNRLEVPVEGPADLATLKLDGNYKGNGRTRTISMQFTEGSRIAFDLEFAPSQMCLWLISAQGFIADYHEENEHYTKGANPVLPKKPDELMQSYIAPPAYSWLIEDNPSDGAGGTKVAEPAKISEITRRNLTDLVLLHDTPFHGRLDLISFLKRIWPLDKMPSTDPRFENAAGDIWQHMINNSDWSFSELLFDRLDIIRVPDEQFGRFLELCVHPLVLPDSNKARELAESFNVLLKKDSFLMEENERISGRTIYKLTSTVGLPGFGKAYDVVLSFAGEDRSYVERVAETLRSHKISVFYDTYEEATLWGKDLAEHLHYVYSGAARFCVMFISKHYAAKMWPTHERRSAFERALEEKQEYILPARFDDTAIPGLRKTIGYIDLGTKSPEQLAALVLRKLGRQN